MRNTSARGQALIFFILLIPIFILLAGIIVRSGKTLLVHQHIENHCNKKVLDALAAQGKGLQLLGKLNPVARSIINSRRKIDTFLESGLAPPPLIPELIAAQTAFRAAQIEIAAQQRSVTMMALESSLMIMKKSSPQDRGKIMEDFKPQGIFMPHQVRSALKLHVTPELDYEDEKGAPLQLDTDFDQRQEVHGQIVVKTEGFLNFWSHISRAKNMTILCEGKILMKNLEDKWSAQLFQEAAKPSLNSFSE